MSYPTIMYKTCGLWTTKCDIGMVGAEAKILTLHLQVIRRSKVEKSRYLNLISSRMKELGIWSTHPKYWSPNLVCFMLLAIKSGVPYVRRNMTREKRIRWIEIIITELNCRGTVALWKTSKRFYSVDGLLTRRIATSVSLMGEQHHFEQNFTVCDSLNVEP